MQNIGTKILISMVVFGVFLMPLAPTVSLVAEKSIEINLALNAANAADEDEVDLDTNCGIKPWTWHHCIASWIYYLIYAPLAFFAQLAAQILDFFIYYSIGDSAYRSNFVEKGWAAVRDIANMFFILALLYVAIQTILSLHSANTKKMVGMIILIALLINFSLFTTRVVIDASNILAKIFYNNIVPQKPNGNIITTPNYGGERSITVGLVEKFDPATILGGDVRNQIGIFAVTLLLSILLMGYMIYLFISIALVFIGRVIALWLAMIFSPIAFISYTVPFDIPGFGHKEWWKLLLENAFLAPMFIFFLYIIIMFGDFMTLVTYDTTSTDDFGKMMKVIIPFAIVFILLMKAKKTAVTMSGEIGAGIMKAGAVVGGLALGGAALGGAALMRGTAGSFMKGASTGDTAANRITQNRAILNDPNAGRWQKLKARADIAKGQVQTGTGYAALQTRMGQKVNADQTKVEEARHARHELDSVSAARFGGKKFNELTLPERDTVRTKIARDKYAEANFGKKYDQVTGAQKSQTAAAVAPGLAAKISHADDLIAESKHKQGLGSILMQSARTGSFDVRNLSQVKANTGDDTLVKFASGLTSVIGSAMRGSLKSTLGIEHGTGQKALFKDLGHTISEALKGAKMHVDLSNVGHVEKEDSKGGGGGHH